jgi:hypothetical protein
MNSGFLVRTETGGHAPPRLIGARSAAAVWRVVRMASGFLMVGALAACGSGSEEPGATGNAVAGTTVTTTTASACTTAPSSFTSSVWKSMEGTCTACHAQGRAAGGTRLLFLPAGSEIQNYNVLRDFAAVSGDLLLSKTVGLPTHGGGRPFGDTDSQAYKDLAQLVPEMTQQVCVTTTTTVVPTADPGSAAGGFWQGVAMASDTTALARSAVLFAGRNPTAGETAAVGSGGAAALRQTIRGYLQGPVFERFLNDVGDTHFLTPGVVTRGNNMGLVAADWATAGAVLGAANVTQVDNATRNRFDASVRREPIELMKYIVLNDRPYTDIVAGNYTVVNGLLAEYLGAQVQGSFTDVNNDSEWRVATLPEQRLGGNREHAGVLSTHAWLQRFPTTDTNRNRHRVATMYKQFLGTDVTALAVRPIDDGGNFKVPTVENPACAVCHDTIDPAAAGFQNWNERNRFRPNRTNNVDHALPNTYRSNNYPKDAAGQAYYQAGDNWFRDGKEPGFGATPMPGGYVGNPTALQWLGQQVAADSRFAMGAVHFWYQGVFGRAPLASPIDQTSTQYAAQLAAFNAQHAELQAIADKFRTDHGNGAYNVRDLLVDLVTSQWFRAERSSAALSASRALELRDVGSVNMLPPSQLNQKMIGLIGQGWSEFDNPYTGFGLNYGDFNGNDRMVRAKAHTMLQSVSIDRLTSVRSCTFARADFDKPAADRLLFPLVALTDLPDTTAGRDAITANIRHLHKVLWKEDVPADDPEVQRTLRLFTDVWGDRATVPARPVSCTYNNNHDRNYTGRTWAAILAYMVGDPKFLFE